MRPAAKDVESAKKCAPEIAHLLKFVASFAEIMRHHSHLPFPVRRKVQ
jgi:hypothetical protein